MGVLSGNASGEPPTIVVSTHALDRLWERFSDRRTPGIVRREVVAALQQGRTSKRRPPWLGPNGRAADGDAFYVWPAGHDRVYVVAYEEGGASLIVRTVLPTPSLEDVARAGAL